MLRHRDEGICDLVVPFPETLVCPDTVGSPGIDFAQWGVGKGLLHVVTVPVGPAPASAPRCAIQSVCVKRQGVKKSGDVARCGGCGRHPIQLI